VTTSTNPADRALRSAAARVGCELQAQDDAWGTSGWTRRRFLAGAGMVGVAALGSQLVTARAAYAATPSPDDHTLVVVFLRGAADGLRVLVPAAPSLGLDYLKTVRGPLVPAASSLVALPGTSGWALNGALRPLYDGLWSTGELAFVPAVSAGGINRSHFAAQQFVEKGGVPTSGSGWLERVLPQLGTGTTFRAVALGGSAPASLAGDAPSLAMDNLANFSFPGWSDIVPGSEAAIRTLYRGVAGPLGEDVPTTLAALSTAARIQAAPATSVAYPDGDFAGALKDLAKILRAEVGMQIATVDAGGWDTHTDEAGDLDRNLSAAAAALRAFMDDLGPDRRSRVTVAVVTEFGRRVEMNASGGTDHGHGSVMWLLGGGLTGSGVYGKWTELAAGSLDSGDVPGLNNPFDVLGELAQKRLGVGSLASVFPGHSVTPLGVATTT
jgi:uncharacterized protein (DUF1501 family)